MCRVQFAPNDVCRAYRNEFVQQILVRAVVAAEPREAVLEDSAGQALVHHLPDHWAPRAVLAREALVVAAEAGVDMTGLVSSGFSVRA